MYLVTVKRWTRKTIWSLTAQSILHICHLYFYKAKYRVIHDLASSMSWLVNGSLWFVNNYICGNENRFTISDALGENFSKIDTNSIWFNYYYHGPNSERQFLNCVIFRLLIVFHFTFYILQLITKRIVMDTCPCFFWLLCNYNRTKRIVIETSCYLKET